MKKLLELVSALAKGNYTKKPEPTPVAAPAVYVDHERRAKQLKSVLDYCHWVTINCNDIFAWGCADCEEIQADDIEDLLPLIDKYGPDVLFAVVAVKRSGGARCDWEPQTPVLRGIGKDKWEAMAADVIKLAADGTILFEEYWEREGQAKYLAENPSYAKFLEEKKTVDSEDEKK